MNQRPNDPAFDDMRQLALKLEAAFAKANAAVLKAIALEPEAALASLAEIQGKILGFDDHGKKRFREALEEKRIQSLAQGNLFMTCVLASAVALSEFKSQPRAVASGPVRRQLDRLRGQSTNGLSLGAFAFASFYALCGKGALSRLVAWRQKSTIRAK